ncbi:MAG: nucleotidyltransferase family protein [Nitrospirae bacterium]|nr:nucleotidyltransferase family protein [Nitrospirota bacterium]
MGRTKQLLPIGEKPAILYCVEAIFEAGVRDVVVVTGRDDAAIRSALRGHALRLVRNDDPESDMSESIRIGLRQVDASSTGVLVCLADHPLIQSETIERLLQLHAASPDKIIIPVYRGKRGHPSLFPFGMIKEIYSAITLRELISSNPDQTLFADVADEGVILDMDTEEDYRIIVEKFLEAARASQINAMGDERLTADF